MRIGRIAGQYAKPRSSSYEKVGDTQVLSFRYVIFFLSPVPRTLLSSPLSDILPMAALYLQGVIMLTGIVFFFNLPQSVSSKTLLVWILTTVPRIPIVCLGTHNCFGNFLWFLTLIFDSAYFHSAATLNYIRGLLTSGFASLRQPRDWSLNHVRSPSLR